MTNVMYDARQYANNRSELSQQSFRIRERELRRFKSPGQEQRYLSIHASVYNFFNLACNLVSAIHNQILEQGAMQSWKAATAVQGTNPVLKR